MDYKKLGSICRYYRKHIAQITLEEMGNQCRENYKSLSAFENGRANNIRYIFDYYLILDSVHRRDFLSDIFYEGGIDK